MMFNFVREAYLDWMIHFVQPILIDKYSGPYSYDKLLTYLHTIPFVYYVPNDENRAGDGVSLRFRYAVEYEELRPIDETLYLLDDGPCSVLEMLVGLALRCEETIQDDTNYGNRTEQWFWGMIANLGLGGMYNANFDQTYVDEVIDRFHNRQYEPDGQGGLFRIRDIDCDLRKMEIWRQMCWYINSFS